MQRWKGGKVRKSGDGMGGEAVRTCKSAKVETWGQEGDQWKRGRGDKRYSAKVQIGAKLLCKSAKTGVRCQVSGVRRKSGTGCRVTGKLWTGGRGDKRYSANVQRCKGGGKNRPDCRLFGVEFEPAGEGLAVLGFDFLQAFLNQRGFIGSILIQLGIG